MKQQHKWEKLSKYTHGDSGLAFVASLSIATLLMVLALIGVAVLWQASAQAQEPSQDAASKIEKQQDGAESESADAKSSESSSSSSQSTDSDESASSESSSSEKSDTPDEPESASESADATSAASAEADGSNDDAVDSASAESTESSDDEAASASSESADSADKDKGKDKRTFKREIKLDNGKRYTITVSFDESAKIPANAKLDIVRVMQTPKGYDPDKSEWKNRPTSEENFVSATKMKTRIDELEKALKVHDEDYVFYTEFLDISLTADGEEVTPAAPIEVIVETDAVGASASDAVEMSFYTKKNASALDLKNLSGDKAKDKAYKKGAKVSFKTKEFTELGIAEVATPLATEQAGGFELTILGPKSTSVELGETEVGESVLPEGFGPAAAYVLDASPDKSYGTKLWVEAKAENKAAGEKDAAEDSADAESSDAAADASATDQEASEGSADANGQNSAASESVQQGETDRAGYLLHEGDLSKLFGSAGTTKPVAVDADDVIVIAQNGNESDEKDADADAGTEASDADSESGEDVDTDTPPAESQETTTIESADEDQSASLIPNGMLNATSGAYSVKVAYGPEANIPEGSTLEVHELYGPEREFASESALHALDAESATYSRAFDIKILDAQGNEVEPAAPINVSITLENAPLMENPSIVHLASDAPDVISPETTREKGACTLDFTTDGFSVYVVLNANRGQTLTTSEADTALSREMLSLDGSWATWRVVVNSGAASLNGGENLVLADTFDDKVEGHASQSIDYASINVAGSDAVTYDYSENTGTFVIPDSTKVTITYRTRVTAKSGQAVANATFQGTAVLKKGSGGDTIATATATETHTIYPSASDVAGFGTNYMVKLFTYADGQMQTGVAGAKFILLDANKRAMTYKLGDNAGQPITFVTGLNGYANVELSKEDCGVSIEKNTAYYLEMVQAPEGYQKDNTLYSFMITDDPGYNSGGTYTYYNGDTMKVRLNKATTGLRVSLRFSGNYTLTQDQQNAVTAVLQKYNSDQEEWEEIERHSNSDAQRGTITFDAELVAGESYRVVQEGERPWDLPDGISVTSTYYCLVGSGESSPESEPQEFFLTKEQIDAGVGVDVVIDNCYEEHELSLTKMDKETGDKLKGAVFTVKKAEGDTKVTSYTTDESGVVIIRGGEPYVSDTLYYVEETTAPSGYLLPLTIEKTYFYFCTDPDLVPTILHYLPEGETAVNLSETFESLTIDNQKAKRTITVMKTWQGNTWPADVSNVVVGLYQSVDGAEPTEVLDEGGQPRTVTLTKEAPYNNSAFKDMPTRSSDNKTITYSIKEEHIYKTDGTDAIDSYVYVQEYGVSDAGVYIVRNREATGLTINKEWYDRSGTSKITDPTVLANQSDVTFDVYRTTEKISDDVRADGITYEEMEAFVSTGTMVRSNLSFGKAEDWTKTISDLAKKDDAGNPYYYYVLETVPSFGDELYAADEAAGTVTIQNKVAPDTTLLTVTKTKLVDDPRPNPETREFNFTLVLKQGRHPIRNYTVFSDTTKTLTTDWNGEAKFVLTPEHGISLTLPVGVTAAVTEAYNPEYKVDTKSSQEGSKADDNRTFSYEVTNATNAITYTNTLHVICMVVDKQGTPKPFESFSSALAYIRANPADTYIDGVATIQMLEDYTMPATDVFDVQEDENIVLTTATTNTSAQFHFRTNRTEPPTDTAIITRGGISGSMLSNLGTLTLGKVCLDGDGANTTVTADGGLVNSSGILNLSEGTILRNSAVNGKGGAIFATGTLNMPGGNITGNSATSGSAIYLGGTVGGTLNMSGGSITGNKNVADGAVVVEDIYSRVNLSGNSIISENTNARGEAANLYIGADTDKVINVVDPGLGESAHIGVTAMAGHREIGEQFAFAEVDKTANLSRFTNDTYGYRGKLKDGTETNVVWDGLTLKVKKEVGAVGANPNDTFVITLSSPDIKKSNYTIDGTVDYAVTPARGMKPGTIKLNSVRASNEITISPLPVASYTITEDASNYTPTYEIVNTEQGSNAPVVTVDDVFVLDGDSTVTVTNTRRLADVSLTKTLQDKLVGDTAVGFEFTVKLTEADDTPVKQFPLYEDEDPARSIITNDNGEATFTMSPTNALSVIRQFKAPVGATMTFTETANSDYSVKVSAETNPASGEGTAIEDKDADHDNIFAFTVTDDGANVTFANKRKMAEIELSKKLVGKVSKTESFDFTVTLLNGDGTPASNYIMHDADEEWAEIKTGDDGKATIQFSFGEDEEAETKSVTLTIPDGTSLSAEETVVKKDVSGAEKEIYDTTYSKNGGSATTGTTATIESVTENDTSIAFTNARKMQTIKVTNTVAGYSGNVTPFSFTAAVTDGGEDDYDANGFTDGQQTFELATGQSKELTVPYGATLTVAEGFIVGYETLVKHGSKKETVATSDEFQVSEDVTVAFTNNQLINIVLVNNTSHAFENVCISTSYATKMYRVWADGKGQDPVPFDNRKAYVNVAAGETAILEVNHQNSVTYEQDYAINGDAPEEGYYYTIYNEPSFHESANPAVLRVYNTEHYEVKGKLRYSTSDSTITFTEQPLVTFDANGGAWTTEMEGYHDSDGNRQVYQIAVNSNEAVAMPQPDPIYPTAERITFLGWTADESFAKAGHTPGEDISAHSYDFSTPVTGPLTLYAVWAKAARDTRVVTVQNACTDRREVTATLTQGSNPVSNYSIADDLTTDGNGVVTFSLDAGGTKNLTTPDDGAKLVLQVNPGALSISSQFTDADTTDNSFTIDSVTRDGTVVFAPGICKITDSSGAVLYDASGQPAVYTTLADAFTAYNGTLYTDASHSTSATQSAVKMLIDEYAITSKHSLPTKDMTLTTAGKNDARFPYVGTRDRSTLYRGAFFTGDSLFALEGAGARKVSLTNIVLDGGSEQGVKVQKNKNGGLISMSGAAGVLDVNSGTTMRNVEFAAYDDANNGRGGAIYITNGTLNVKAGEFTNLHAYQGGAICATGGTLNVTGTDGSTRFEKCYAEKQDGGAICYKVNKSLVIDGGGDKSSPGVVFAECVAKNTAADGSDGGAIYAETTNEGSVTVSGCSFTECSAKTGSTTNAGNGGGAIDANKVSGLTVSHCVFNACDTLSRGGAIVTFVANGGTVSIEDSSFEKCNCKGQGGAVAVYQPDQESKTPPASAKTTKLILSGCEFSNCSSGTQNGSGGAIQCYVPCMEFSDTTFTDCWAGKEGGAVNNYFGNGYTVMWEGSYLTVDGCYFIRCRAEDRYDPTALQHYGGGINTKAKTATITNSYFEDCVSTLKEGGALHLGGQAGGSSATVTGSTFKGCSAKNGGGALLASAETLTVTDSNFYGCSSFASNGGAVYHYRNSRGDSTQNTTTITGCTFSNNPEVADSESCSAAENGGAVWTRATTVTISSSTFKGCTAKNGGGVYQHKLDKSSSSAIYENGTITGCQAETGSAVFVSDGNSATFSSIEITENIVSTIDNAAVQGGGGNSKLFFEGNVQVKGNTCSVDPTYDHDVLMQKNNSNDAAMTVIQTTSTGLSENASVGVYVPDSVFERRGTEGKVFGTFASGNGNAFLDNFFNDRDDGLLGYQLSTGNSYIYWGRYLCKITDAAGNTLKRTNGRDAVYQRLTVALDEFTQVKNDEGEACAVYIKMLVENYDIQQTAQVSNFPAADVTLTTASKSEPDNKYPYKGADGTVCTISRTNSNNDLFLLNNAGATFQLEGITLDGRKDKTTAAGDYRLLRANSGTVVIRGNTTLQYGKATNGNGGAVYVNSDAALTITSDEGKDANFAHCYQIDSGNPKQDGGGAIYSKAAVTINGSGKTYFTDCSARRGGAIMVDANSENAILSIENAKFSDCHAMTAGGAVYHNNPNNDASTSISNSTFENCGTTSEDQQWTYGGAVNTKAGTLTVNASSFTNCHARSNGGAINHGSETQNRVKTEIVGTTFTGCGTTGTNKAYGYGGSVFTQAMTVDVRDCSFENSASFNRGGALYCESESSVTTISGTSFDHCTVARDDGNGGGGAISSKGTALTLQDLEGKKTSIDACSAPNHSGAVYMETDGSTLNISGNTTIKGCYAKQGGAIYLKNSVTMNLADSPEFRENGFMSQGGVVVSADQGACIYLEEGSTLNFAGSPKFSRNILPGRPRVVNGGVSDYVRQDVYLAGYGSINEAKSIHVSGELTGDTIWVWPEFDPHRMPGHQFARTESSVSDATLNMFRNALSDDATGCSNGEYLAGIRVPGSSQNNVYWDKMYVVSFRKIDNKGVTVSGAEFTLYNDKDCTSVRSTAVSADGETDTDVQGNVLEKGVVEFASVPIGAYYMKETAPPPSFTGSDATYLVLVGSPWLQKTDYNKALWEDGGPLDVPNAETLVARYTTDVGRYYGIFALQANGKADLSKSYASTSTGIENIRTDYEAYFMKVDSAGAALPNAVFKVYTPEAVDASGNPVTYENGYPKLTLWSRDGGETYPDPARSADGTTDGPAAVRMLNGNPAPKGLVYFRELPIGTYYLLETAYPERNGDNKITSYVQTDRVLKLEVKGQDDLALSELLKENGTYTTYRLCEMESSGYYTVGNMEASCKLTDGNDKLLYELGGDGSLLPAVYSTLEEGFDAAQTHTLYDANGNAVAGDSALKLKALKDFTLASPVTYSSPRSLTFTTAERTATPGDRFVFVTNRTSYTSRAEISRAYTGTGSNDALITVANGASLTLQNVSLNGQKANYSGRAVNVSSGGSLTIQGNTRIHNFADTVGSAIYVGDGATVTIGGGTITGNVASDDNGGAINVGGENARLFFTGAPMVFNNVSSENTSEQRNVVLSENSNEIIQTETGLTGGKIGVYAIDGTDGKIYEEHGRAEMPFGTFGHAKNLNAFVNDRDLGLYGVRNETNEGDVLIYWSRPQGSYKIVLRKVRGEGSAQTVLSDATFAISRSMTGGPIELDGKKLENLRSNADGVFFVGVLAYGDYYLKESSPTNKTFKLIVDKTGYTVEDV